MLIILLLTPILSYRYKKPYLFTPEKQILDRKFKNLATYTSYIPKYDTNYDLNNSLQLNKNDNKNTT